MRTLLIINAHIVEFFSLSAADGSCIMDDSQKDQYFWPHVSTRLLKHPEVSRLPAILIVAHWVKSNYILAFIVLFKRGPCIIAGRIQSLNTTLIPESTRFIYLLLIRKKNDR